MPLNRVSYKTCLTWASALLVGLAASGSAQAAKPSAGYVTPTGKAPVTNNNTDYSPALFCLADSMTTHRGQKPRVAVGRINDLTGKVDFDTGARVSQGASLFAITALGKAGLPVVERLDAAVAEIEINYAKQHLLSDTPEMAGKDANNYRKILAGQIAGSSYFVVGGITELNNNIASSGVQAFVGAGAGSDGGFTNAKGSLTTKSHVMNIGIDLRLIDTRTQEVVRMVSYQKQIRGYETSAGLSGKSGDYGGGLEGGRGALEPVQAAVRTLIERGIYDFAEYLYFGDKETDCINSRY
ncbi:MAG: holdfast anchoring protein HfaB [Asticcacaulis sp.]